MYWARLMEYQVYCVDFNLTTTTVPNPETQWMLRHEFQLYYKVFYHPYNYKLQYYRYMRN